MSKYRKKPIVIDAVQWQPHSQVIGVCLLRDTTLGGPHVHTLEGPLHVSPGDWIITGVNGERYPCKPDVFEKTYEAVNG